MDPFATALLGEAPVDTGVPEQRFGWDVEPEPVSFAPAAARFLPREAVAMADNNAKADAWYEEENRKIADQWQAAALAELQAKSQEAVLAHDDWKEEPSPYATGDADRGIGQPGRMPETISAPKTDRRTGNLPLDLFNANIGDPIRRIQANAGPEGESGALLESAGVVASALPFGVPGKAPALKRALDETADPVLRGAIEAFNTPPAKASTGVMDWMKMTGRKIETAVADRFAAMNAVGPETEAAKSAYLGRAPAATQRVAQDLGEAVRLAGDDLPQLNTYVGLQRYIETAGVKGNPDRLGPGGVSTVREAKAALAAMEAQLSKVDIPPPKEGLVRLYRGQAEDFAPLIDDTRTATGQLLKAGTGDKGRYFTTNEDAAKFYNGSKPLLYVDVPKDVANAAKVLPGEGSMYTESGYVLPIEIANQAKRAPGSRWDTILEADKLRGLALKLTLQRKVNAGFLDQKLADQLMREQPHYNPTVIEHYLDKVETSGGKLQQNWNTLKRLTDEGSESDVLPPMQAAMKAIYEGEVNVRRNRLLQTMVSEGGFPVKAAREFTSGPLVGLGKDRPVDSAIVRGALSGERVTVVGNQNQPRTGQVSFWRDGKHYVAEVPDDIAKAANNMTTDQIQGWEKAVSSINQTLRLGATAYNPAFLVTNAAADAVQSYLIEGIRPDQLIRGYVSAFRKDPSYQRFVNAGGGFGAHGGMYGRGESTAVSLDDLQRQIQANGGVLLKTPGDVLRAIKDVARGGFGLEKIGSAIEQGPRIATFNKLTGKGMDETQAAMRGRRVTVDFERAGQWVQTLNSISPFLNARTQGTLNVMRSLRDRPKEVTPRLAGLIAASVPVYAYNRQFPEYADVPDYIKQNSLVLMLPGSEPNESGTGFKKLNYVALPLREWGAFMQPVRGLMEYIDGKDPEMMDVLANTLNAASPMPGNDLGSGLTGLLPPVAKVPLEQTANFDFFRGRQIVPEGMEDLPPQVQVGPHTTKAAQELGERFGLSPLRIDSIVQGLTGGGGKMAMQAVSQLMGQDSDKPPVVGGLLSGVLRNQGGQLTQNQYKEADALYDQYRDTALGIVRDTASYENATQDERFRMLRAVDTALRQATRESVGLEKAEKDYGLPPRYRGVEAGSKLEADIAHAFSVAESKRTLRERSLAARYDGKENPAYARAVKARTTEGKTLKEEVKDLVKPSDGARRRVERDENGRIAAIVEEPVPGERRVERDADGKIVAIVDRPAVQGSRKVIERNERGQFVGIRESVA